MIHWKKNHLARYCSTILTLSIKMGVLQSDDPKVSCLGCEIPVGYYSA